jgi:hypothetical protein
MEEERLSMSPPPVVSNFSGATPPGARTWRSNDCPCPRPRRCLIFFGGYAPDGERTLNNIRRETGSDGLEWHRVDLHPGTYVPTKMVLDAGTTPVDSLETGVRATMRLIELDAVTVRYFNREHEARAHAQAYDADARPPAEGAERAAQRTLRRSTTKTSVSPGAIAPPAPRSP